MKELAKDQLNSRAAVLSEIKNVVPMIKHSRD